jgi:hypothetical protein
MWPLGTELDAPFAANTFGLIDHTDIAVLCVDVSRAGRTILDAERRYALPADCHNNVERIFGE